MHNHTGHQHNRHADDPAPGLLAGSVCLHETERADEEEPVGP